MKPDYKRKLEKLDHEINLERVREVQTQIDQALNFDNVDELQYYIRYHNPEIWPVYPGCECKNAVEKDLMTSLSFIKGGFIIGMPSFFKISTELGNYGIIHSLFGGKALYHENQCKWLEPVPGMSLESFIDKGVPEPNSGITGQLIDRINAMLDILVEYENLSGIPISPIDVFGVLETACALIDPALLITEMMLNPAQAESFFDLILQTTINYNVMIEKTFEKEIRSGRIVTFKSPFSDYHEYRIVEDSAILLSPELYAEFCRKYNQIMFERFAPGGGAVHFCGDGSHLVDEVLRTKGLKHFDPGQIEFYDFDDLYKKLAEARVSSSFRTEKKIDQAAIRNYLKRPGLVMTAFASGDSDSVYRSLCSIRVK
jgi:hypothetical protein